MRKYILKVIFFLLGLIIILSSLIVLSSVNESCNQFFAFITCSDEYQRQEVETQTIIDAMDSDNNYKRIIVGDSVCSLLLRDFQDVNDIYYIGELTRPSTIATQYVMVKEFIKSHPETDEVYLMLGGETWRSVIDVQLGYSYFVVPNSIAGTINDFDDATICDAEELFGTFLMNPSIVKLFDASLMNHKIVLNTLTLYHEVILGKDLSAPYELTEGVSDLSLTYFKKIEQICRENDIKLYLIHDPLADTEQNRQVVEREKEMFKEAGLYESYSYYFDTILYYPPECFFDGVHVNLDKELQSRIIQEIKKHTGLLDGMNVN